jgi:hypothetical protein
MIISEEFKNTIKATFYDKEFLICNRTESVESDGQVTVGADETATTFLGNARFNDLTRLQEDYGIKEQIEIVITTDYSVVNGIILKYGDRYFEVIKVIPFDSHNLIMAKQWLLEYSGLTSA